MKTELENGGGVDRASFLQQMGWAIIMTSHPNSSSSDSFAASFPIKLHFQLALSCVTLQNCSIPSAQSIALHISF
jgi:hypothetical protein